MMKKIFKVTLCFVFLLSLGSLDMSMAQSRLDIPTANLNIANAVPMHLIKKIALEKSKETWGPGALGGPVPLADLNGNLVAYMFPYRIGKDQFPAYDEILQGIKEGRELRNLMNNAELEKAKEKYMQMDTGRPANPRTVIVSSSPQPAHPPMDSVRPDGTPSRREEFEEMNRVASDKAMGAGEFGTILVSATYDAFPVPAYLHYLAPYYINFDLALEKAAQAIGQGASLKSIYYLGPEGQYLEFVNNSSSVLIHGKSYETKTLEALKNSKTSQVSPQPDSTLMLESKERIKVDLANEWAKIKSEIGEK